MGKMQVWVIGAVAAVWASLARPALADDRLIITDIEQKLSDAITNGAPAVWETYLDPNVIYAEEDGTYKGKAAMVAEVRPLPKDISGEIKVELLSFHQDGDIAVALFRQHESETYFGQTIFASYLLSTVWKKEGADWREIEGQVLAERTDPPTVRLSESDLGQFVGEYRLKGSTPTMKLTVADGNLAGARAGKAPVAWAAETRDVFYIKGDPRIRNIFQYDANGHVTGFVQRRESWDIVWEKVS